MSGTQNHMQPYSDEELAALAKAGREDALTWLVCRYAPMVRARARRFAQGALDEEDLFQEGMIALLFAVRGFQAEKGNAFCTFAAACVNHKLTNAVVSHMRQKNAPMRSYISLSDEIPSAESFDVQEDPVQAVIEDEEADARRRRIVALLTSFEQQVLTLYLKAFSYGEMAKRLGVTNKAVDNALQRIRRKLRRAFAQE